MSNGITILIAEDNPGDVFLIKRILGNLIFNNTVAIATDGEGVMNYLYKSLEEQEKYSRPDFILLDLNLPKIDGLEILSQIKTHPKLKLIPVIIFSSSQAEKDVSACYERHANCYVVKPYDLEEYQSTLENICNFWINRVILPTSL